jgi:hypothetical protein
MRKILVHPGGTTLSGFLPGDARQVLKSEDDGPGLRFRQVGKETRVRGAPGSGGAASRASVRI